MNILIINHSVKNCGVYQYGKRFGNILTKSSNHNFIYREVNSFDEFRLNVYKHNPSIIIYNCVPGTLPWLTNEVANSIKELRIKQGVIVHNTGYQTFFDFYLHQNPYHAESENNFAILRPLFEYNPVDKLLDIDNVSIGTFGFGFNVKHVDELCSVVNSQLFNYNVTINLHLTHAHFGPPPGTEVGVYHQCLSAITSPNIKINFTNHFIDDQEVLDFLSKNDLNIFFYEKYSGYNGISSCIDYALSVKRPIAICKSNMFSHISDVRPPICVEDAPLLEIIRNGFGPLEDKYSSWSNENFINKIENIVAKLR